MNSSTCVFPCSKLHNSCNILKEIIVVFYFHLFFAIHFITCFIFHTLFIQLNFPCLLFFSDAHSARNLRQNRYQTEDKDADGSTILPGTSRLARLLHAYLNLLRAGPEVSTADDVSHAEDRNENGVFDNYSSSPLTKGFLDSAEKHHDNTDLAIPSIMTEESNGLQPDRLKRQQGWYIQYGKRNIGTSLSVDDIGQHPVTVSLGSVDETAEQDEPTFLIPVLPKSRLDASKASTYAAVLPGEKVPFDVNDDLSSVMTASSEPSDSKMSLKTPEDWNSDQQITNVKRQQGWHIQYGKRSDSELPLFVL